MKELVREIESRRALRALKNSEIPDDMIDRILTAGTYAPSCMNKQPWRFLVLPNGDLLNRVKEHLAGGNYWAKLSPFVIAVCTKPDLDCRLNAGRDYALFDTGMAVAAMLIQGVKEGLNTHPIAGFDPLAVKDELGIPGDIILVALIVFGYPGDVSSLSEKHQASETSERTRKPLEDIAATGRWPDSWE